MNNTARLISHMTLRRAVGIIGISFPFILLLGSIIIGDCREVQTHMSAYYHTIMRDPFVGILSALALLLFAYKGYDTLDNIAGNLGCLFALLTAFFPTSITDSLTHCIPDPIENGFTGTVHIFSAGGLLLTLAFFSIFLFTKSADKPTKMKGRRNRLYRVCGYIMVICIALIGLVYICDKPDFCARIKKHDPIFWLETLALLAFGTSWLVKGNLILTDR
jgi:hypothetical protein